MWVRRPKSATDTAAGGDSASNGRREKTVPESVVSAVVAAAADDAAVSAPSKQHVAGRKKKKRKMNSSKKATAAKKRSKATPDRYLPTGVTKRPSGNFASMISWRGKRRYVGTFDTPEQASAAYLSVKKDLEVTNLSALSAVQVEAAFGAAKTKARAAVGWIVFQKKPKATSKRDLPKGVWKTTSQKSQSFIWFGGKDRYIGTFDTLEQASDAYISVMKDLAYVHLWALGADEVDAAFDSAQMKARDLFKGFVPEKRDLTRGVTKTSSWKFQPRLQWGGTTRCIGTFDTPRQASAAFMLVKKDLVHFKLSELDADKVDAILDAAQKKAVEAVGGSVVPRRKRAVSS